MRNTNDLWEAIGALEEEECGHVLTKLFSEYEQLLQRDPANKAALDFFKKLANALTQTTQCNLNRR